MRRPIVGQLVAARGALAAAANRNDSGSGTFDADGSYNQPVSRL